MDKLKLFYDYCRNGHPYTEYIWNGRKITDAALLSELPEKDQATVLDWIKRELTPAKRTLKDHTSYGIKHILQHDTGIYLTNNAFKDAMFTAGYLPAEPREINWSYKISKYSPAFDWRKRKNKPGEELGQQREASI